MEKKVEN
jgi:hypothetical protein